MSRTDTNGMHIEALLHYLHDGHFAAHDIADALGVSHATYFRRKRHDDYPNADELVRIAAHFNLNPVDLMVRFGVVSAADAGAVGASPVAASTKRTAVKRRRKKFEPQPGRHL